MLPTWKAITELDPAPHITGYDRADTIYPRCKPQPGVDARDAIAEQYNYARELVLKMDYDALLTVECDMLPPPNAIRRLWQTGADVAYGVYVFRRKPWEWSAYSYVQGMGGIPLSHAPERAKAEWGEVVAVDGMGLGCTLIQRKVLEKVEFRAHGGFHGDGNRSHADWYFCQDVREMGFSQRCDLSVVCGHIHPTDEKGTGGPCVLWPDITQPGLVRFEPFAEYCERRGL